MNRRNGLHLWLALSLILMAVAAWVRFGPIDSSLLSVERFQGLTITDRYGVVLHEPLSSFGTRGLRIDRVEVDSFIARATIVAEDRRFLRHWGVDPLAVIRASLHNLRAGRVVEGGSTLSQQTAKLLLRSPRRSVGSKLRETLLAMRLEHRFTKRAILTLYLNLAPYGNQIHGVERASNIYFGVAPDDLTIAQAAYLAALPQRPSAFNPRRDVAAARARQQTVIARMLAAGVIEEREAVIARAEHLRLVAPRSASLAQHFVERVLERCTSCAATGTIATTLDGRLQRDVQGIIAAHRPMLQRHGARSVAVAVLDNATGDWLAWEGSGDYFGGVAGGAIDGVVALRQPGSTLKPFTYAVAFEQGFTPASVLDDKPSHFATAEEGVVYTPRNYDGRFRGAMRARHALAGSVNVPAVGLLEKVGPETLLRFLRSAGFDHLDHTADYYGLGLTLGDAEVTLESLVTGYAMFARGGEGVRGRMVLRSGPGRDGAAALTGEAPVPHGVPVPHGEAPVPPVPHISSRTAFWISDILADAEAREFIFGRGGSLEFSFPVAAKTGTSQAYRDNWTIGYTPEVTVGVWVGNFDVAPLRNSSGVTGAAPIFHAVMLAAMKGRSRKEFVPPSDLDREPICAESGHRPSLRCSNITTEWIARNAEVEFCGLRHEEEETLPAPVTSPSKVAALRIVNPANGATYMIDPTLRTAYQALRLRAESSSRVQWRVNERNLPGDEWSLRPGRHTIIATDAAGRRDAVTIFVK